MDLPNNTNLAATKLKWIDCCKRIGMVAVVLGHGVKAATIYVFFFHMPLFFFLSGYLYKAKPGYLNFVRRKARHLLIPYLSFILLLALPVYLSYAWNYQGQVDKLIASISFLTFKLIYGGSTLSNYLGTFWFITCLFLTQQTYAILYASVKSKRILKCILAIAYLAAMLAYWFLPKVSLPWSLEEVPMALLFYGLGHWAATEKLNLDKFERLAIAIVIAGFVGHYWLDLNIDFNMKYQRYGTFIVNLLMALSGIILTRSISKTLSQNNFLETIFSEIGSASMVILYLHQTLLLILNSIVQSEWLSVAIALVVCYSIYKFIARFALLRQIFLGEVAQARAN